MTQKLRKSEVPPLPGTQLQPRIEILSVDLLDQERPLVEALRRLARRMHLEFGWHYLLDLVWILRQLGEVKGLRLMDAGAGVGVIQWYLAEQGAEVISVDRTSRALLSLQFRAQVRVEGLRPEDLLPPQAVIRARLQQPGEGSWLRQQVQRGRFLASVLPALLRKPDSPGRVLIYNQDLTHLVDIPDQSLDAVVAVSALEHNTPEGLQQVVQEILRVLKPGGALLATLTTAGDQDIWHAPSAGWCYSDQTLRRLFDLGPEVPSNYADYPALMAQLRECQELRDNLASFYFKSDQNGMPWGKWDPQYQPVGICKIADGAIPRVAPSGG